MKTRYVIMLAIFSAVAGYALCHRVTGKANKEVGKSGTILVNYPDSQSDERRLFKKLVHAPSGEPTKHDWIIEVNGKVYFVTEPQ